MRRRVLYCAKSRPAARAARLLGRTFAVRPLPPGALPERMPTVLLTDGTVPAPPPMDFVRVIGIVPPRARGPWPTHWYALLPAGVGRPILARAVERAFRDLESGDTLGRLARELSDLNTIGIQLSAERDPDVLLASILTKARAITGSDAGSLYLVEDQADGGRRLVFALAQNDSIDVAFEATSMPVTEESVAGHVALRGDIVNLADAYAPPPGAPFHINRAFDEGTGYRTKSMLVVPMRTPKGETIGVLQLINCKRDRGARLRSTDAVEHEVQPFDPGHARLAGSLASQAAVAFENRRLYDSVTRLFEGFVQASVTAIEQRDPTTSGHSFRVADLTERLALAVQRCDRGPYRGLRFTDDELMELRYAALLHDFGKVAVREQVLVKAKKLYPDEMERIRLRAEIIRRGVELRALRDKLEQALALGADGYRAGAAAVDIELTRLLEDLDRGLACVSAANEPEIVATDSVADLAALTHPRFENHRGQREALLTAQEARALEVVKGSLTAEEYREIQSHVVHTYDFLARIPWTREYRRVPIIARYHHEKLDGSGYPDGIKGDDIPVQSRMMAIADIFDALTAFDRPYKRAIAPERALDILGEECRAGLVDADLFAIFTSARVWVRAKA
ncbi:MAG: HD domain-containing phosphohydrolase [Candidatus Rokuibacteriota bacterium]